MKISSNLSRISAFFWRRRNEIFNIEFWKNVFRVFRNRFNWLHRIPDEEFRNNLRIIEKRPWNLHIELTNICNANCIFCAYQYQKRVKMIMDDLTYRKALDSYCDMGGGELMLEVVVGDPAIDGKLLERIVEARKRSEISIIKTTTNGINLDRIGICELIESGISKIIISTGPWEKELYEKIYRTPNYYRMKKNITELLKTNQDKGNPVDITIAFRSNLSMKATLSLTDYKNIKNLKHSVEFNTDFDTWRGEISQNDLLTGMFLRPKSELDMEPCYWFFDGPIVFSNGLVGLCGCRDYNADSELIIGSIHESTLKDLWQSGKVREIRERFYKGDYPDICKNCTAYANLDFYRTSGGTARVDEIISRSRKVKLF